MSPFFPNLIMIMILIMMMHPIAKKVHKCEYSILIWIWSTFIIFSFWRFQIFYWTSKFKRIELRLTRSVSRSLSDRKLLSYFNEKRTLPRIRLLTADLHIFNLSHCKVNVDVNVDVGTCKSIRDTCRLRPPCPSILARLLDYTVAQLPDCLLTRLPGCLISLIIRLPDFQLPDCPISRLPTSTDSSISCHFTNQVTHRTT